MPSKSGTTVPAGADRSRRLPLRELVAFCLLLTAACTGVEEKRIRELLNEKGFGSRAEGVATYENYVAGGDGVVFYLEPALIAQPGTEQLALLTQPQQVGIDGTIHVPYVGNVPVLGLTERELESLVEEQLQGLYEIKIDLTARIVNQGKVFYAFGETGAKGRLVMPHGDMTILEAISIIRTSPLANLGRIQLIRPDAENPLTMEINFRELVLTGNTTYNVLVQNNDIIYVPPTFFGMLTRFVEKLLQPLAVVVRALFGVTALQASYDYLFNDGNSYIGRRPYFGF